MASLGRGSRPVAPEPEPETKAKSKPGQKPKPGTDDDDDDDGSGSGSEIRVRYKLSVPTYQTLLGLPRSPERRDVLQAACQALEFRAFPVRSDERALLRAINDHTGIPYALRGSEAPTQPWHKVFLLVQAEMTGGGWPAGRISAAGRRALMAEGRRMWGLLEQVLRCAADVLGRPGRRDGRGVSTALDVLRSVRARVWEGAGASSGPGPGAGPGAGAELLQVEGIGRAYAGKLAAAGVRTVRRLAGMEFYHIERVVGRNPPFGHEVLARVAGFPLLTLRIGRAERCVVVVEDEEGDSGEKGREKEVWAVRVLMGYENEKVPSWCAKSPVVTLVMEAVADGRLLWFWRGGVRRLAGGKEIVVGLEGGKGERVRATLACEEIVGTKVRREFDM